MTFIEKIVAYMRYAGYKIYDQPGELNIVYVEGANEDGSNNPDEWDRYNDRRIVLTFEDEMVLPMRMTDPLSYYKKPITLYNKECTTEPGKSPTFTLAALKRGGIFRIAFGQYLECWQMGFHKSNPAHPALVQIKGAKVFGYRDRNRDGKRTGDVIGIGSGINQHGTKPGFVGSIVGMFSEGCLVARYWSDHLEFMRIVKMDVRYKADPNFKFSATVIAGDALNKMFTV
jgi:hypothetical protein